MLPRIVELELEEETLSDDLPPIGKSFLYDFEKGDFVIRNGRLVEVHGIESLKVWIEKVIRTEVDRFRIYKGTGYGVGLEKVIGSNLPEELVEGEIERKITETLTEHPHINRIERWWFERDGRRLRISFRVITSETELAMEVTI